MKLDPALIDRLDAELARDDARRLARYPGTAPDRQPVHTVYLPGNRFTPSTVADWGAEALATLDQHGPIPGFDSAIDALVRAKLATEPIEDLRLDFEDGYGTPDDDREDADVRAAATALATVLSGTSPEPPVGDPRESGFSPGRVGDYPRASRGFRQIQKDHMTTAPHQSRPSVGGAPGVVGIRMKSLEGPTRRRGIRTLELFLDTLLDSAALPVGFRVTLPKVTSVVQVAAMTELCAALDQAYALPGLRFELQVETPQAILGADGTAPLAPMIQASEGRCVGLHYGTYDYSASVDIAAAYQSMDHPAADHAKAIMQVAAAGTGIPISDGSTNVLPVGTTDQVREAWQLHARLVRRSLERGFYQGWDLHPAQLPTRYAATFAFYRDGLPAALARLRAYREQTSVGILDEPATERALTTFLHRAVNCGATTPRESGFSTR